MMSHWNGVIRCMNGSLSDVYELRIYMLTVFYRIAGSGEQYYSAAPCAISLFLLAFQPQFLLT